MRKTFVTGTIFAAFLAAGCSSSPPVNSVEAANPQAHPMEVQPKQIITDSAISGIAQVLSVEKSTVSGNLLKIQVRVFNGTNTEAEFFYKFEWVDSQGMAIDSPMSIWKQQTISANEDVTLTGVAPNPDATDFRLKLQTNQ